MQLISDIFLAGGAFGAALYCFILQRRLSRFTRLENSMGSAVALLSAQVDDLTRALSKARATAAASTSELQSLTAKATAAATKLELLLSSLHDLPQPAVATRDEPSRPRRYRIRSAAEVAE